MRLIGPCSLVGALALSVLAARPVHACGGYFPEPSPSVIEQTGVNVLFVLDEGRVETHIQMRHDPDTDVESFAWIIPVPDVPEFAVGSEPLFTWLLGFTSPTYALEDTHEACESANTTEDAATTAGVTTDAGGTDTGGPGGVDVLYSDTVGAFDIVVLEALAVEDLTDWLTANGYAYDPEAAPVFAYYLDQGHRFAAFKMTQGADIDSIHPIALSFDSLESCIPLRLTRLSSQEDLEVRAFFLSDARVGPQNYRHVVVNPLRVDWIARNPEESYRQLITNAVDVTHADGRAFVTEMAGPLPYYEPGDLLSPLIDADALASVAVTDAVDVLEAQGLLNCNGEYDAVCHYFHPLIAALLGEFLPVPAGLTDYEFYSCLECHVDQIDGAAWDAQAFADAVRERIQAPGLQAQALLAAHPYLTRLYTIISPLEMTEDPVFVQNPDLPDVPADHRGERHTLCHGDAVVTLPDGRELYLPELDQWPDWGEEMPWAEDVEETLPAGAFRSLADHSAEIDALLAQWNLQHGWTGADTGAEREDEGCGCRARGSALPPLMVTTLGGLALFGWRRRRAAAPANRRE